MPLTMPPLVGPGVMVAAAVLLLAQVPPVGVSLSVMVAPVHTLVGPVMLCGDWFTVTVVVAMHMPPVV